MEDAPAGALSGLASGAAVLAVGTGYHPKLVRETNPTYYVEDLSQYVLLASPSVWGELGLT